MDRQWVVVADAGRARALQQDTPDADLRQVEEWVDDRAHGRAAAFQADAHGRRGGEGRVAGGNATTSAQSGDDVENQHEEAFARRVAQALGAARRAGRYDTLRVAAAPAFLGKLRPRLEAEVGAGLVETLDKDLVHESPRELTQRFCRPAGSPTS
jgi:protein required for attachment to host cells